MSSLQSAARRRLPGTGPRLGRLRARLRSRNDEGFTLVEVVVALFVFGLVASAAGGALLSGLVAQQGVNAYHRATALGEQALEEARSAGFKPLAITQSTLTSTPEVLATCAGLTGAAGYFVPDGLPKCEALVTVASGGIAFRPTSSIPGFSITRYVTWVDAAAQGGAGKHYKRITVHVDWTDKGRPKSYHAMTLVSDFDKKPAPARGVAVTPTGLSALALPGRTAVLAVSVTNNGTGQDLFNLTATPVAAPAWATSFTMDMNKDGSPNAYGTALEQPLGDANIDGIPDTGKLAAAASTPVLTLIPVPVGTAAGTYTFNITATSTSDAAVRATRLATLTVYASAQASTLYLHNSLVQPLAADSTTKIDMPMDTVLPTATYSASDLPNLSTDQVGSIRGRYLPVSSSGTSAASPQMADWIYSAAPGHLQLDGNVIVTVYAQGCADAGSITAWLGMPAGGVDTPAGPWLGSASAAVAAPPANKSTDCTGKYAQAVTLTIPLPAGGVILGSKSSLELKITAPSRTVILGYDSNSTATYGSLSKVILPVVAT